MHILQPGYEDLATVQPLPLVMLQGGSVAAEGGAGLSHLLLLGPGGSVGTGSVGGTGAASVGGAMQVCKYGHFLCAYDLVNNLH
jgi:hypothetical protein